MSEKAKRGYNPLLIPVLVGVTICAMSAGAVVDWATVAPGNGTTVNVPDQFWSNMITADGAVILTTSWSAPQDDDYDIILHVREGRVAGVEYMTMSDWIEELGINRTVPWLMQASGVVP